MDVNKPSTRCLCVQYTLFMVANVYIPTKLLFSLSLSSLSLDLLQLLPLKGDLTPLLLKDHPSNPGNQMAFVQYVETRCRREGVCLSRHFRSCTVTSIAGEGEGYLVRREFHKGNAFTYLHQYRFYTRPNISSTNTRMIANVPA